MPVTAARIAAQRTSTASLRCAAPYIDASVAAFAVATAAAAVTVN